MRKIFWIYCIAAFLSALPISDASAADDVSISDFLSEVQKVLIKVRDAGDVDDLPHLKSVDLTMSTTLTRSADGGLKFHVVELGVDTASETDQEIELELAPPQASDRSPVSVSILPLADAIIDASRQVKAATKGEPPLHLQKLTATIEFTIERNGNGSLVLASAKAGAKHVQKVVLTFEDQDQRK